MHWTKQVNSVFGHRLNVRYDECGGIRFTAPHRDDGSVFDNGAVFEFVLLYAEDLGGGRYNIGCTYAGFFDSGRTAIPLFQGVLNRVPASGEFVEDWITDETEEEAAQTMATGYRFLRDNGLDGDVLAMVLPDWAKTEQ